MLGEDFYSTSGTPSIERAAKFESQSRMRDSGPIPGQAFPAGTHGNHVCFFCDSLILSPSEIAIPWLLARIRMCP